METVMLNSLESTRSLIAHAHAIDEPLIVYEGGDECLVAMRPAVFERILFDSDLINSERQKALDC